MPPSRIDFERMFNQSCAILANAISGREAKNEWINPYTRDKRTVALELHHMPVNTADGMFDFSFVVHSDCPCSAIAVFLGQATLDNISFAEGPRGGKVLGVSGRPVDSFYCYKQ